MGITRGYFLGTTEGIDSSDPPRGLCWGRNIGACWISTTIIPQGSWISSYCNPPLSNYQAASRISFKHFRMTPRPFVAKLASSPYKPLMTAMAAFAWSVLLERLAFLWRERNCLLPGTEVIEALNIVWSNGSKDLLQRNELRDNNAKTYRSTVKFQGCCFRDPWHAVLYRFRAWEFGCLGAWSTALLFLFLCAWVQEDYTVFWVPGCECFRVSPPIALA